MTDSPGVSRRVSGVQQVLLRHWLETMPNDRLAHLVKDAARGLARSLQARLADYSVSFGNWIFLRILWEQDGLTQRQLSIEAGLAEPTTFTALKTLERRGYIRRKHKPGSLKLVFIYLTSEGKALRKRLEPLAREVNEIAVRGVSPDDVASTRQTLLAMIRNLAADEAAAIVSDRRVPSTRAVSRMGKRQQKPASRTGSAAQI
jgi:MarR family transcriptional regulator, organic hydroperoxide resistance regulator